ncbi:hypothetical protein L227DRAFT_524503 [Lentinus tigrinus ALCF2SS1-6]|uniref:GDP/GTP exchange factor Sec2 N-terminal domain-containing protein n=1 Tax=Lentinus tigrinus ALCF2SS1-6 TaxID=1328759 RepID=A0A5C2SBZ7_9APHY|nr:hypothetical protein L227DRAFT_524503 [Lentinus tigrinus ALCF2SS1-6]
MAHAAKPSVDSEMHELNAEADLLEQKTTVVPAGANGEDTRLQPHNSDPDAQAMVIESLRNQVQDLFSQVSQLNNKLVRSYDRVSDLEDELHVTSANLRQATLQISQLELERTQHLSALSTGLLVEKSHVTAELTRLMEKATEEAARRGQAESARAEIEKDLDDLSAGLFGQANTMVAEARIAEARSARKLEETEAALRSAEEVVGALQAQMQALESEKERADRRVEDMRVRMGKGKWIDRSPDSPRAMRRQLFSSHVPYHEFLVFVSHLRAIRPASVQPPAMSTLLPLPLLARLVSEDSDPTVRLDLAPSLNWLSRRSVIAAIHSGQLTVEPMHFTTLLEELAPPSIPASSHHTHITCALCGMPIYSTSTDSPASTPTTPNGPRSASQSASWSTNLFKNVRAGELNLPTAFTGHNRYSQFGSPNAEPPSQLYIFRLDATSTGLPVSLPISQQQITPRQSIYPLCTTGWCLARLRSTCSLWAFVRTSIVEKIWEESPIATPPNGHGRPGVNGIEQKQDGPNGIVTDKQNAIQAPPRKTKMGLGSLWGSMQRSLSGTREPEREKAAETAKPDARPKLPPRDPSRKILPPPPPSHPAVSHTPKNSVSASVHRVPPPFKDSNSSPTPSAPTSAPAPATPAVPPPLPKRNRERDTRSATPDVEAKAEANGVPNGQADPSSEPTKEESPAEPMKDSDEASTSPAQTSGEDVSKPEDTLEDPTVTPKPELVVPSTISRATSNDSFTTPTEELAPPLDVSLAAASVALPSSQESSPIVQETVSTTEPTTDASPADTTAPAPSAPSAPKDDKPPSRTGSPAPPPLPRRAAARARPSSTLVQNTEPARTDSTEAAPMSKEEAAPTSEQEPAAPAPPQDAPVTEESIPVTAEPEQIPSAEEDPVPDAQPQSEAPAGVSEEAEEAAKEEAAPAADAKEIHVNGDVSPADAVSVPESNSTVEPEAEAKDEERLDDGQYVGDATWEERTYKELIRLREEMFWARIGAAVH